MALLDVTELSTVSEKWTENLKNHRATLMAYQSDLQKAAEQKLNSGDMPEVEHYYNQFDIQLNNISHFKHEIKELEKLANWDSKQHEGKLSPLTAEKYEKMADQYQSLVHTIQDLEVEFKTFLTIHLN